MVSVLPLEFRRQHHKQWHMTKVTCVLVILLIVSLYYASVPVMESFGWKSSSSSLSSSLDYYHDESSSSYQYQSYDWSPTTTTTTQFSDGDDYEHQYNNNNNNDDDQQLILFGNEGEDWSNVTFPYANLTSCSPKAMPYKYRCQFVKKHGSCSGNIYLRIQYCVFKQKLEPLYFILAVCYLCHFVTV